MVSIIHMEWLYVRILLTNINLKHIQTCEGFVTIDLGGENMIFQGAKMGIRDYSEYTAWTLKIRRIWI